ncbi:MAG: tetratricopeptide repeat protein [Candidatus Riflebacteria bacterium]|nr:tetratricopeptide repeat protein [Candidatus Riflebacteria bacterium]
MRKIFILAISFIFLFQAFWAFGEKINKEVYLSKAKDFLKQNNTSEALQTLEKGLSEYPNEPKLMFALGSLLEKNGRLTEARDFYVKVKNVLPNYPALTFKIEQLEVKINLEKRNKSSYLTTEQKKAREIFLEVLRDKSLGKFEIAFPKFIDCVDLDPTFLDGIDEGIIKAGLNYYKEEFRKKSKDALYYFSVYIAFMGNFSDAISGLQKFIASNPSPEMKECAETRIKKIEELKKNLDKSVQNSQIAENKPNPLSNFPKVLDKKPQTVSSSIAIASTSASGTISAPREESKDFGELMAKGLAAKDEGKIGDAIKFLTLANQVQPDPRSTLVLGDIYYADAKERPELTNLARTALEYYFKIQKDFPDSPEAATAKIRITSMQSPVLKRSKEVLEYFEKKNNSPN